MDWMVFVSKLLLLIKTRFKTLNDNFHGDRNKKEVSTNLFDQGGGGEANLIHSYGIQNS